MSASRAIRLGRRAAATDVERVTPDALLAARMFTILWAIAHLIHLLRQPEPEDVVVWLVVGAALLLLDRPTSRWRLALLSVAQLLYLWHELPRVDNHVIIMGFVDLGLLVSVLYSLGRDRDEVDSHPPIAALPYVRVALVLAYGAAAIAKLNRGFFDTDTSCAVDLFGDAATVFGDPGAHLTDAFAPALPFIVAAVELTIPLLLLVPATRLIGVALAVVFHLLMSLSPTGIALGFTGVLFALVLLYLPDPAARHLHDRAIKVGTLSGRLRWSRSALLVVAAVVVGALLTPDISEQVAVKSYPNWVAVAPVALVIGALLLDATWQAWRRRWPRTLAFAPHRVVYYLLLGVIVVNAASPYLGGKTITSFTMYSNLQTERGSSNHFFLPRMSFATGQDDLVEVVASSNSVLRRVRENDALITWHELRRRLSADPDASIQYRRDGKLFKYAHARENPELVDFDPLAGRLVAYRQVDREGSPVRCRW